MSQEQERQRFIAGEVSSLRLGGYGGTVHLEVTAAGGRVRTTQPRRMQKILGTDSRRVREAAVHVGEGILAKVQRRKTPFVAPQKAQSNGEDGTVLLTPRDIWEAYLEGMIGVLPTGILGWGRMELERHYRGIPSAARLTLPRLDSVYTVILAARRLDRDGVIPLDADLATIQPGDISRYLRSQVVAGASAHTMATYFGRFRTAVRYYRSQWPKRWGSRPDPTEGVKRPSTQGIRPPEIGEERAKAIIRQLRAMGDWRAAAAAAIAYASGRRIGAIGARRPGLHLDARPLCASDFSRADDGNLEVVWRAAVSKGDGYGQGDVVQVCPRGLEAIYRWLTRYHPNPLGPEYPLIWDPEDPSQSVSYDVLHKAITDAWSAAFGTTKPRGLAWHGIVRTTVTTIADSLDIGAAAEYTGRSVETAQRIYKRRRRARQVATAHHLDDMRRNRSERHRPV